MNFSRKVLIEKEGEVVFDRKYLRLKGKGANDHGVIVNFTDIKEVKTDKDIFIFNTFAKETFELSKFGGAMENFLEDFYRIKNEYFAENMFMKEGMLNREFDCQIEITNSYGKSITIGKTMLQFYEQSMVFIPKCSDVFMVNLNFMKHHEFDEDSYQLQIETDSGTKIFVSKLGSNFEDARECLEGCLEKMYQRVLNQWNQVLTGFSLQVLLKLAYAIKDGKAVSMAALKKIDPALPLKIMELAFKDNPELEKKIQFLRSLDKDEKLYVGFSLKNSADGRDIIVRAGFLAALPNMNTIALGISNNPDDKRVFFFRIVMEQGIAADKLEGKVLEINQCMVLFDYDLSPLLKDKNELRKTKYRVAILRMAFLRLFRRSLLGYSQAFDLERFKDDSNRFFAQASVMKKPVLRHRQLFKPTLK
ncbi:hypothetical protein IT411_03260 [Candidatus Peregrinibacteria bacterium]|nr:hypothetical protein [Candidatus Peregrinibacteria bacterium]